jgi:hypothetical protein
VSVVTWLDELGRRRRQAPRTRAEIRDYAKLLAAIRNELPDDDARLRNAQLQGAWFHAQLEQQAELYRTRLAECWVIIGCLVVIIIALVWPT